MANKKTKKENFDLMYNALFVTGVKNPEVSFKKNTKKQTNRIP